MNFIPGICGLSSVGDCPQRGRGMGERARQGYRRKHGLRFVPSHGGTRKAKLHCRTDRSGLAALLEVCCGTAVCRDGGREISRPGGPSHLECLGVDSSVVKRVCYNAANEYMLIRLKATRYHYCQIDSDTVAAVQVDRLTASGLECSQPCASPNATLNSRLNSSLVTRKNALSSMKGNAALRATINRRTLSPANSIPLL